MSDRISRRETRLRLFLLRLPLSLALLFLVLLLLNGLGFGSQRQVKTNQDRQKPARNEPKSIRNLLSDRQSDEWTDDQSDGRKIGRPVSRTNEHWRLPKSRRTHVKLLDSLSRNAFWPIRWRCSFVIFRSSLLFNVSIAFDGILTNQQLQTFSIGGGSIEHEMCYRRELVFANFETPTPLLNTYNFENQAVSDL